MSSKTARSCAKMDVASTPARAAKGCVQFVTKILSRISKLRLPQCQPLSVLPLPPLQPAVSPVCLPPLHPVWPEHSQPSPSSARPGSERTAQTSGLLGAARTETRMVRRTGRRRRTDVCPVRRRLASPDSPVAVVACSARFIDTATNINVTSTTRLWELRRSVKAIRLLLHRKWPKFNSSHREWCKLQRWFRSDLPKSRNLWSVTRRLQTLYSDLIRNCLVIYHHIFICYFRECLFGDSKYGYLGTFWRSSQ